MVAPGGAGCNFAPPAVNVPRVDATGASPRTAVVPARLSEALFGTLSTYRFERLSDGRPRRRFSKRLTESS